MMSCRDAGPSLSNVAMQKVLISWAQGYMTAINFEIAESDNRFRDLSGLSEPYMLRKFEDGCAHQPDERMIAVILQMYSELPWVDMETE